MVALNWNGFPIALGEGFQCWQGEASDSPPREKINWTPNAPPGQDILMPSSAYLPSGESENPCQDHFLWPIKSHTCWLSGYGRKRTTASLTSFGVLAMCRQCSCLLKKTALLSTFCEQERNKTDIGLVSISPGDPGVLPEPKSHRGSGSWVKRPETVAQDNQKVLSTLEQSLAVALVLKM